MEDCRRASNEVLKFVEDANVCNVVVDVGANIGACTLEFALTLNFEVLAFEPNPTSFDLLSHSVAVNGLQDRVLLSRSGISADHGENAVFIEPRENAGGSYQQTDLSRMTTEKTFSSHLIRLSDVISTIPCIRLLKLDCEGCEAAALFDLYDSGQLQKVKLVKIELTQDGHSQALAEVLSVLSIDRILFMYTVTGKRVEIESLQQATKLLYDNGIIDIYGAQVKLFL